MSRRCQTPANNPAAWGLGRGGVKTLNKSIYDLFSLRLIQLAVAFFEKWKTLKVAQYKLRDHLFNGPGDYPFKFVMNETGTQEVNLVVDKFGHFELPDPAPCGLYAIASYGTD